MKDNTSETEKKKKESKNIGFYASIKQDAKTLWSFPLFIYFLIGLVAIVILLYWQLDKSQRGTGALVILGYIGFYVTCGTLLWTRKTERHRFASERRHEFITNKDFMDIQMKIERTDSELLCLIAAFNTDEPYSIEFRSCTPQKRFELFWLHQYFDNYLNWFESLAISWTQGLVADDELDGLWSYYLMRLRNVQLKKEKLESFYAQNPSFFDETLEDFRSTRISQSEHRQPDKRKVICKLCMKNGSEGCKIDPIDFPLWWYVNNPDYAFQIIKIAEVCYKRSDENKDWKECPIYNYQQKKEQKLADDQTKISSQ